MFNEKKIYRIVITRSEEPELNMVYAEVGSEDYEIVGAFSGICGGLGLFYINQDGEVTVSDDCMEFAATFEPSIVEEMYKELEKKRAEFEQFDEEGNFIALSDKGLEFISEFDENDDGMVFAFSLDASEDMIYDIQDEWNLDYYH